MGEVADSKTVVPREESEGSLVVGCIYRAVTYKKDASPVAGKVLEKIWWSGSGWR